jgi:hypothetical protein
MQELDTATCTITPRPDTKGEQRLSNQRVFVIEHQDAGLMQLVDTDIHNATGHTGGILRWREMSVFDPARRYYTGRAVTPEVIAAAERDVGVKLPQAYVDVLE